MKPVEICNEREEQNGMKIIHYLRFGISINRVKYHMVLIGMIGVRSKK